MRSIVVHWTPDHLTNPTALIQWIQHYRQAGFPVFIWIDPKNKNLLEKQIGEEYGSLLTYFKPTDGLELTIHDYLLEWFMDDQDQFILLKPLATNWTNTGTLGRVFQVDIEGKDSATTFEIPDFIQYKHERHTAFTKHGISLNGNGTPSDRWVCFSLSPSEKQCSLQYYQNDLLINPEKRHAIGKRVYEFYHMNVVVQKDKRYGIIWHPKSGCTTIMKMFCSVNQIRLGENQSIRSLNYFFEKYRYNVYLEEIDYIHFVRNPYKRFLSTFLDKHVHCRDTIFIQLQGYLEWSRLYPKGNIMDVCNFLKQGKYISEHYTLQSKIQLSPEIPTFQIDDERGLNHYLTAFLKKYHPKMDMLESLGRFDNSIQNYDLKRKTEKNAVSWLKHYSRDEWREHLEKNNLCYSAVLDDDLKHAIYSLYKDDFEQFGYDPELPDNPPLTKKICYNQDQRSSIGVVDDFNTDWMQI